MTKRLLRGVDDPYAEPTVTRMGRENRGPWMPDTTALDFTSPPGIAGLGRMRHERQHGMYPHPTLAVSERGVALGVLDAEKGARKPRGEIDMTESGRWTGGYARIAELAERLPRTRVARFSHRRRIKNHGGR